MDLIFHSHSSPQIEMSDWCFNLDKCLLKTNRSTYVQDSSVQSLARRFGYIRRRTGTSCNHLWQLQVLPEREQIKLLVHFFQENSRIADSILKKYTLVMPKCDGIRLATVQPDTLAVTQGFVFEANFNSPCAYSN